MNRIALFFFGIMMTAAAIGADEERVVKTATFPQTGGSVVAAEGHFEPGSTGSYSLRLYAKNDPAFPYDAFAAGIVRPRDGTLESVKFADLDHNGTTEIVVIIRSAGSGSYLSADAFRFSKKTLTLLTSVSGLDGKTDPVRALAVALGKH
jgi:hypothetical protein